MTLIIILSSYLAAERKIEFQSFSSFLEKCFWIMLLGICFLITRQFNLATVLVLWLIGISISFIVILLYLKKEVILFFTKIKRINKRVCKNALIFGLPLVPVTICGWLIEVSNRYLLNYFKDAAFVGIFSLSYGLVVIILSLSGIIYGVLYPYIAKAWNDNSNHQMLSNALLKYTLIVVIPAMTGLFVLRKQIITLISGSEYLAGSPTLAILIVFPLFASLVNIYGNDLLLRGKTTLMAIIYFGGAIVNIILNLFFIPAYGANGAAITTVTTYVLMFLSLYLISKERFTWNFQFLRITRIILATAVMGLILFLINPQMFITKIITIILGALIYIILLFLLGVFIKEEYDIMKSFLPKWVSHLLMKR